MVYVDKISTWPIEAIAPGARRYGREWCHMWADTEQELYEMAGKVSVKQKAVQRNKYGLHFDLTPGRRAIALKVGAVEGNHNMIICRTKAEAKNFSKNRVEPLTKGND